MNKSYDKNGMAIMTKSETLAKFLEVDLESIDQGHDDQTFTYRNKEYLVLTDKEADEYAKEAILDTVWAFQPSFLEAHSDFDESDFRTIQDNGRCEDNNKLILKLINDVDHFVDDAARCDGRGHFLSTYDGEENECGEYYIYRTN